MLDKIELEKLIAENLSTYKIASALECSQTTVRYYLTKYDLKTRRTVGETRKQFCEQCNAAIFDGQRRRRFCNGVCQQRHAHVHYITLWMQGKKNGEKGVGQVSSHVRRWLIEQRGEQCWGCGWNEKHPIGGNVPIEVDHIDGNHANTVPDNLRLLCPNCHSLTPTYKNRNKGNGRHSRRERYASGKSY